MRVRVYVEFSMKKYEKIKQKLNDLEEIDFTPEEYHLIFESTSRYFRNIFVGISNIKLDFHLRNKIIYELMRTELNHQVTCSLVYVQLFSTP